MAKHIKGRQALCIGINDYGGPNLNGCVRDATNVGDYLYARGFNVSFLYNEAASWSGILGAMAGMVRNADVDSRIVIYFSGHGSYVRDLNGDELDRYDEVLVPSDYLRTGAFVLDDDIWTIFNDLPSHASLTFIADSCHSGGVSRFLPSVGAPSPTARARYLPLDTAMQDAHTAFRLNSTGLAREAITAATPRSEKAIRWANLSMCEPTQVSYEDVQEDGNVAGTGTTSMLRVLRKSGRSLTLGGLLARMRVDLGEHRAQNPQLDAGPKQATRTLVSGPPRP